MPLRAIITEGTTAGCTQAKELVEGMDGDYLLVDKAYDTDAILSVCAQQGTEAVIPAKRNRKHDEYLYGHRHLVENAFLWLKRWRGIVPAMRKARRRSWQLCKFAAWLSGVKFCDDSL